MKLRPMPILISVTVTALICFGGWFIYNSVAMKDPILKVAQDIPGVEDVKVDVADQVVKVDLHVNADANIGAAVGELRREAADVISGKKLQIEIEDQTNEQLDMWWSKVLFQVAEAMENRRYGEIPNILTSQQTPDMTVETSMDDQFVYVKLTSGDDVKIELLERIPTMMGVWANE